VQISAEKGTRKSKFVEEDHEDISKKFDEME
jgi:hypothetical protein